MPILTLEKELQGGRPLVLVEVKPSLPQQANFTNNIPHQVPIASILFLVDTGATATVVDETVIAGWHLHKNQPKLVLSGGVPVAQGYNYDLALRLAPKCQQPWYFPVFSVATELPTRYLREQFKGIIGMDMLRGTRLLLDLPSGDFELHWS